MSKKRKRIRILRGKFYTTFHTGRLGHPSLVFRLDWKRNKYWIVVFDTTGRNDRIMLKVPIETTVKASFVHKKTSDSFSWRFGWSWVSWFESW